MNVFIWSLFNSNLTYINTQNHFEYKYFNIISFVAIPVSIEEFSEKQPLILY